MQPSGWMRSRKSWPPASCGSEPDSQVIYPLRAEKVRSTVLPTRAVMVANRGAGLEGNDAEGKNDHRTRTPATGGGQGTRCDGARASSRSEADAGQRPEGGMESPVGYGRAQ